MALPAGARAQTTPSSVEADRSEEIIVTAQRREEDVRDVPIAVTVLSGDAAERRGVTDTADIATIAPSLEFNRIATSGTPFIRGVGAQLVAIGSEPSVATYIDDIYVPQGATTLFHLNGIESISILRGPQGTLFGRNATGGVVQVRTRDPTPTPEFDLSVGYANYGTVSANAYLSGQIANNLSANLAVYYSDQPDGWGRDLVTGQDTFTSRDYGARAKLLWTPWEGGEFTLSLAYNFARGEMGLGNKPVPGSPFRSILTDLAAAVPGLVPPGGFYDTYNAPLNDVSEFEWRGASLRFEQDLGWASLVSITGWQQQRGFTFFNQDGTPLSVVYTQIYQPDDNRSQELQLVSPNGSPIQWIVGAYYYWDQAGYGLFRLRGAGVGFPDPLGADMLLIRDDVTTTSIAAYGQATAAIADNTNLTLGVRYTDDERTASGGMTSIVSGVATPLTSQLPDRQSNWSQFTYRVALDHHLNEDAMVYASYNRGFKSGVYDLIGFSQPGFDPDFPDGRATTARPVEPEILDAYEIGAKVDLFDHRVRLNVAAFYNDFQNIQLLQIITGGTQTLNAGSAAIEGLEFEFSAAPSDHLTISGGFSVMHGEYTDFPVGPIWMNNPAPFPAGPLVAVNGDLTGNDTIQTPHFTGSLAVNYRIPMSSGDVDLDLSYYYNDGFYWEPDQSVSQPSYSLVNAAIRWTSPNRAFEVRVWGRNLLDEEYFTWATTSAVGSMYSPAAPRTFGVTLSYHLGGQ
jgi:iron complex outermembrane receptor protein